MFAHHLRIIYTKQSGNELILIKDIDDAVISKLTYTLYLKGNCHELHMLLSKFVCGNMPGFLATFRSRDLLFCL